MNQIYIYCLSTFENGARWTSAVCDFLINDVQQIYE
jgi:hypothetical protein